jgi:hypothetical protein
MNLAVGLRFEFRTMSGKGQTMSGKGRTMSSRTRQRLEFAFSLHPSYPLNSTVYLNLRNIKTSCSTI